MAREIVYGSVEYSSLVYKRDGIMEHLGKPYTGTAFGTDSVGKLLWKEYLYGRETQWVYSNATTYDNLLKLVCYQNRVYTGLYEYSKEYPYPRRRFVCHNGKLTDWLSLQGMHRGKLYIDDVLAVGKVEEDTRSDETGRSTRKVSRYYENGLPYSGAASDLPVRNRGLANASWFKEEDYPDILLCQGAQLFEKGKPVIECWNERYFDCDGRPFTGWLPDLQKVLKNKSLVRSEELHEWPEIMVQDGKPYDGIWLSPDYHECDFKNGIPRKGFFRGKYYKDGSISKPKKGDELHMEIMAKAHRNRYGEYPNVTQKDIRRNQQRRV